MVFPLRCARELWGAYLSDTTEQEATIPYLNLRAKVLAGVDQRSSRIFSRSSQGLWLRSERLQRSKCEESQKARSEKCGYSPYRQSRLGCERKYAQKNSPRAGPSRRMHRNDQVFSLWIQQTQCKKHFGNGSVRPTCDFGFQYEEIDERMGRFPAGSSNELLRFSRQATEESQTDEIKYGMCE